MKINIANPDFGQNVSGVNGGIIPELRSSLFIRRTLAHLNHRLGPELNDWAIQLYVASREDQDGRVFRPSGRRDLFVVIADETDSFRPERVPEGGLLFKAYRSFCNNVGVHAFPVGYFDSVGQATHIPFEKRHVNVFFSGCLNRNRLSWYSSLSLDPCSYPKQRHYRVVDEVRRRWLLRNGVDRIFDDRFPASYIRFTRGFAQGLAADEYASKLSCARIAVCPPGFVSHETIRHWEAMRLGCVIVSGVLPANRFYRGSPIIQISNWDDAPALIDELLNDPLELEARNRAMRAWWHNVASEEAVAAYMLNIMNR